MYCNRKRFPLTYGGWIFNQLPALRNRIPGHFLGEQVQAAPSHGGAYHGRPSSVEAGYAHTRDPATGPRPLSPAVAGHRGHRGDRSLFDNGITHAQLSQANRSMGLDISAALALVIWPILGNEIDWVRGLLLNHHFPAELLDHYLTAYYQSLQTHLDERGQPILTWLAQLI